MLPTKPKRRTLHNHLLQSRYIHRVPKLVAPLLQTTVCSTWISTKYCTLHYLNITYGHTHTHYDVHTLSCVLNVMQLWRQSCLH